MRTAPSASTDKLSDGPPGRGTSARGGLRHRGRDPRAGDMARGARGSRCRSVARFCGQGPRARPGLTTIAFEEADGRSLPFAGDTFDAVVFHTTLCHVPDPVVTLHEAVRVLRPGGRLAVFEGDYATGTLATGAGDPLNACAEAFREHFVHDPWLVRRLPALVRAARVDLECVRSYGYVEASTPGFMLPSWVDLGADALVGSGRVGAGLAVALKAEARRRVASGEYFGHIAYISLVARKPV